MPVVQVHISRMGENGLECDVFGIDVATTVAEGSKALPQGADRIGYWRERTGDQRFAGHAMTWFPMPPIQEC